VASGLGSDEHAFISHPAFVRHENRPSDSTFIGQVVTGKNWSACTVRMAGGRGMKGVDVYVTSFFG
jgi:hypothetical protein